MKDLERILSLWRELQSTAEDYVLATVVAVEGSSYRKPGALMIVAADGRRAGTVSGGCLEAEVASRAWWLTANGPTIQRYSTADDDGERPYGSGCGGMIYLLLERRATAAILLAALEQAFIERVPFASATVLEGPSIGFRAFAGFERGASVSEAGDSSLAVLAKRALADRASIECAISNEERPIKVWADFRPIRPGLGIFGSGDDAQPLLRLAKNLGWYVTVADGRSHLATRERFYEADQVDVLPIRELPSASSSVAAFTHLRPDDAAIVMTHSFEQDSKILACLLALAAPPHYIGVLGPQRRTHELLFASARLLNLPESTIAAQVKRWLIQLHAPTGLDLGADSPETIAFSVLAEIQKSRTASTALPLREVRAVAPAVAGRWIACRRRPQAVACAPEHFL